MSLSNIESLSKYRTAKKLRIAYYSQRTSIGEWKGNLSALQKAISELDKDIRDYKLALKRVTDKTRKLRAKSRRLLMIMDDPDNCNKTA